MACNKLQFPNDDRKQAGILNFMLVLHSTYMTEIKLQRQGNCHRRMNLSTGRTLNKEKQIKSNSGGAAAY